MRRHIRGDAMDDYLWSLGFWRKPTAKDGSCLFRAVSEQIFYTQAKHLDVRNACIRYLERNKERFEAFVEGPFDHHIYSLRNPKEWAGQVEISALSLMYKHDFIIYQHIGRPPVNITQNNFKDKIYLCFSNGNHYDSVYPKSYLANAAVCQSIVYEVLYKNVYRMDNPVDQGLEMVSSNKSSKQRKDSISSTPEKGESPTPENQADCGEVTIDLTADTHRDNIKRDRSDRRFEPQRTLPFPYRIAKALDPEIYRNVEYDSWLESKKDQQYRDLQFSSDLQFAPGDKCQVSLTDHPDKVFNAHIQDITSEKGPVNVFIEELGEKHTVPLTSLKPVPQSYHQGWTLVTGKNYKQLTGYYQKAQINEDPQGSYKRKGKKKKDMPVLVMSIGRGQGLSPRLQSQQTESGLGHANHLTNRGSNISSMRNPPPRFGPHAECGNFQKTSHISINTAGYPVKNKWTPADNFPDQHMNGSTAGGGGFKDAYIPVPFFYTPPFPTPIMGTPDPVNFQYRIRQRHNSGDFCQPSGAQNGHGAVPPGAEERSLEESLAVCEIQDPDSSSFPALPNRAIPSSGPRSFWSGHQDGSTSTITTSYCGQGPEDVAEISPDKEVENIESSHTVSSPTPIPQPDGRTAHQLPSSGASTLSSASPGPSSTPTPPPLPQTQTSPTHSFIPPAGSFPFYPFLVIPHVDNTTGPVNYNVLPSRDPTGSDLPHSDPATLRFFYNLGCEYYRMSSLYQMQQQQQYASSTYMNGQMIAYQPSSGQFIPQQPPTIETHPIEEDTAYLNGQCKNEFCRQRCKSRDNKGEDKEDNVTELFDDDSKNEEKCDCECHNKPSITDSGCGSDASSGVGENLGGRGTLQETASLGLSDGACDSHSDSSSQRSTSNISSVSCGFSEPGAMNISAENNHVKIVEHRLPSFIKPRFVPSSHPRVIRPLKEIPPRFQKMLCPNGNSAKKSNHFEGQPLVRQNSPKSKTVSVANSGGNEGSGAHTFNPNAQTFIPSQSYDSGINMNGNSGGMFVTSPPVTQSCYAVPEACGVNGNTVSDGSSNCNSAYCSSLMLGRATYPTYTIHVSGMGSNGGYVAPNSDISISDGSGFCANSVPSPAGYVPCPGNSNGAGAGQNPGPVYYTMTNQGYASQPYVPYQQPQAVYGGAPPSYVQYGQPGQYPMSV